MEKIEDVGEIIESDAAIYENAQVGKMSLKLNSAEVLVTGIKVQHVEKYGDKLVLVVKHPVADGVEISKVRYLKGNTLKESGLWLKLDSEGCLVNPSAVSVLLSSHHVTSIAGLKGLRLQAVTDEEGYLVIKAY